MDVNKTKIVYNLLRGEIVKLFSDPEAFKIEFQVNQQLLNIPGIQEYCILMSGVDERQHRLYFIYVQDRQSLDKIQVKELTKADRIAIYKQLDICVSFLNSHYIYHQDLHIGNVIVQLNPVVKVWLIDFEKAVISDEQDIIRELFDQSLLHSYLTILDLDRSDVNI